VIVACLLVSGTKAAEAQTENGSAASASVALGAPGQPALDRARASWEKGDYDVAEPLYAEAIEKGGLAPADVLEAYVHLGSTRAVLGKKAGAVTAFRAAARLDAHFAVPPEAGKRAITSADQARRLEGKTGALRFHAEIPTEVAAGDGAQVDVTLDANHAATPGSRIGVLVSDPPNGGHHVASVRAAKAAHFDLPSALSLPSATLHVRVDWLDAHANRLASAEEQVHVQPLATATPLPAAAALPALSSLASAPPLPEARVHDVDAGPHGSGFWHTAWPYILGGAALAAGGAAIYFATRSGDDVNVTGVRVVTH
jgi:predicted secreted protein